MALGLRTIDDQASSASQLKMTTAKLSFQSILAIKKDTAIKLNTGSVFTDYSYYLRRDKCTYVFFNEESARRYAYRPKLLANAIYKNIEFAALILRLNHMKSVSDFTMERLIEGILVPFTSVKDFFNEVLIKEKLPINRNGAKVESDIRLTQK